MNRAISVLFFSSDPFVAYLHIAYVLSVFGLCIEMSSYVVYKGKVPGVYDDWEECQAQVNGVSGASHKASKADKKEKLVT